MRRTALVSSAFFSFLLLPLHALMAQPVVPSGQSTAHHVEVALNAGRPSVLVVGGTALKVSLTNALQSNSAHVGDKFAFRAAQDVAVDGWLIIAKDAIGEGTVAAAEGARGNGHPGKLGLSFDWIFATDGLKIRLANTPSNENGGGAKGAASTATIASYIVLGPLGLFAHNFVHGKDVTINPEATIPVYVAQSVHITPKTKIGGADGFAR